MDHLIHEGGGDTGITIGGSISMTPPRGWFVSGDPEELSISGALYSRSTHRFCPPDTDETCLTLRITTSLVGAEKCRLFKSLTSAEGRLSGKAVEKLHPYLVNVPPAYIVNCAARKHIGLGPALIVDFLNPDVENRGRVMYTALDDSYDSFLVVSYIGREPHFRSFAGEVRDCVRQIKRIV